ncbi:MAG: lysophospholipase [Flammeovirgaceae bacterium]|nr:lysophospholipase [Flammeovirgaceae bacterium]
MKETKDFENITLIEKSWIIHFPAHTSSPNSVTLVVHGLNNTASIMDDITQELNKNGSDVIQAQLKGHRMNGQAEMNKATVEDWFGDLEEAYEIVVNLSKNNDDIPVYFVGFSLGGLLNLVSISKNEKIRYNKMLLFAPAVSLTFFSSAVKLLRLLPSKFLLPNITPKPFKANRFTSIKAYQNLLELIGTLQLKDLKELNVPTKIIIDPKDELVSLRGIRKLKGKSNLNNWEIILLKQSFFKKIHHLIVVKKYLSQNNWDKIRGIIRETISN